MYLITTKKSKVFAATMMATSARTVTFDHGAYEELDIPAEQEERPSPEPLKVMGTPTWLGQLERRCQRGKGVKRVKLTTKDANGGVTGKGDILTQREHYCQAFGDHVAQCAVAHVAQCLAARDKA